MNLQGKIALITGGGTGIGETKAVVCTSRRRRGGLKGVLDLRKLSAGQRNTGGLVIAFFKLAVNKTCVLIG